MPSQGWVVTAYVTVSLRLNSDCVLFAILNTSDNYCALETSFRSNHKKYDGRGGGEDVRVTFAWLQATASYRFTKGVGFCTALTVPPGTTCRYDYARIGESSHFTNGSARLNSCIFQTSSCIFQTSFLWMILRDLKCFSLQTNKFR